jgi:hypothetical protein
MRLVAKCMIRNKPDSYCAAHDIDTTGISDLVQDLIDLYAMFGVHPAARPPQLVNSAPRRRAARSLDRFGSRIRYLWERLVEKIRGRPRLPPR